VRPLSARASGTSRRRLKLLVPVALLGLGALGVATLFVLRPRIEPAPPKTIAPLVRVQAVQPEPIRFSVRAHGTVAPRTESDLIPQVSAEVIWVSPNLVSGGFFEKGDPLVRLDPADYEAELESARAAVARAESEHLRAEKQLARQRRLAKSSVASESRMDDAENAFRVAEAQLREARARLGRAERDLARTELEAPYAGRVRQESVDVGQFVTRGAPVARLYAIDYAEVRLPLPDRELAFVDVPLIYRGDEASSLEPGPEVLLRAEFAGAEYLWSGRVVRTEGEIDAKSRMVHVVAQVEDPYGVARAGERPPLAVGLFVEAEILGRSVADVVRLPRSALREDDEVAVVDEAGRLRFRPVTVLRRELEHVVIGEGLAPGERVLVSALPGAVDGMTVRVLQDPAPLAGTAP